MQLREWYEYGAAAVCALYLLIAGTFIMYTFITGTSSSAWDTTTEFIALSHCSRPSNKLSGTCAGIASMNTLAQPMRIAVRSKPANTGADTPNSAEQLELLFGRINRWPRQTLKSDSECGNDDGRNTNDDRLEFGIKYGSFKDADSVESGTSAASSNLEGATVVNSSSAIAPSPGTRGVSQSPPLLPTEGTEGGFFLASSHSKSKDHFANVNYR